MCSLFNVRLCRFGAIFFYVLTQICIFSFASKYPNKIFIDIHYVPMDIRIDVYQKLGIRLM